MVATLIFKRVYSIGNPRKSSLVDGNVLLAGPWERQRFFLLRIRTGSKAAGWTFDGSCNADLSEYAYQDHALVTEAESHIPESADTLPRYLIRVP